MKNIVVVLVIAVGIAMIGLMAPNRVAAEPNPPIVFDPPLEFSLPSEETGCGFEVHIEVTGKFKLLELPNGQFIATAPAEFATVTNTSNGNAVTLNITGSFHWSEEDGFTTFFADGRNLLWGGVEDALILARGRFSWTFDPDGNVSPQSGKGNKTDVCALIA